MRSEIGKCAKAVKVCFVSPKSYPLFDESVGALFGGAEVDMYYLATELAKDEGFDVSMVVADYGQEQVCTIEGVRLIKSLTFCENSLSAAMKIYRALAKADADVYMIKTISAGMFLTAFFCWLHKKIFTYRTAHSNHCDGSYAMKHPFMNKGFLWSLRKAKMIFTQSVGDGDNLKRVFGFDSIAINNGHRLAEGDSESRDIVLWVGRSAEFKRPEKFIELARQFPDERFVMICQRATGDDNYDALCRMARGVGNLEFYERVGFHKVDKFFERAKVFVNTSDSEGFPNTFIQACKGRAAILSYKVDPDGFLGEYECGVCAGGDEERLARELEGLLADDRYVELGENGRRYAEERHDIAKIVAEYKKIFNVF